MIGFTPQQVDAMSLWQFHAALHGWRDANAAPNGPTPPSSEEHQAAMAYAHTIH